MVLQKSVRVVLIVIATVCVVRLLLAAVALCAVTAFIRSLGGDTVGVYLCAAGVSYAAAVVAVFFGGKFVWRTFVR